MAYFRWTRRRVVAVAVAMLVIGAIGGTVAMRLVKKGADSGSQQAVTLDFNRAVNLPCAYTDFATCPLPPAGNRLPVAVEAGEQTPYERAAH